jgi:hypothetical protein
MDDLISRQMLLEYIHGEPVGRLLCDKYNLDGLIKQFPSAQPERKTGKWIDEGFYADGHGAHAFRCSECGGHIIEYDADPFCRWCGAYMRGEQDE